jgi:hypothetical protein
MFAILARSMSKIRDIDPIGKPFSRSEIGKSNARFRGQLAA